MQPKPPAFSSVSSGTGATSPARPAAATAQPSGRYVIERLYALWITTTVVLAALIGLMWLLSSRGSGSQTAQTRLAGRIAELEQRVAALEQALGASTSGSGTQPTEGVAAPGSIESPRGRSSAEALPSSADAGDPAARLLTRESQWREEFERVLRAAGRPMYALADRDAARSLLAEISDTSADVAWGAATLERAALLAVALDEAELADALAGKCQALNHAPLEYLRFRALTAIRAEDDAVARECIRRLSPAPGAAASALLLRAELALSTDDGAAAEAALSGYRGDERFTGDEAVRLGFVFAALERWTQLDRLLESLLALPAEYQADVARLHAIRGATEGAPAAIQTLSEDLKVDPADREARYWLALALVRAERPAEALPLLADATLADDPAAHVVRAHATMQLGDSATVDAALRAALAIAPRHYGANELAAVLELNRGEWRAAAERLRTVIAQRPRRASAHFLLALAQARAGQIDEARRALARALELDPSYRQSAEQAEVLAPLLESSSTTAPAERSGEAP